MKKQLFIFFAAICSISAFAQTVPAYLPTAGLVGWWPFNGNANDESGNGNSGVPMNGTILCPDRNNNLNNAYSFDGNDDYIQTPISSNYNSYSFSAWINPNVITQMYLFGNDDEASSGKSMYLTNGGGLSIYNCHPTPSSNCYVIQSNVTTSNQIISNNWTHVLASVNSGTVTYYVNGINAGQGNGVEIFGINWSIGAKGNLYSQLPFNGKLDDIGVWNRALTDCEIQKLYNADNGLAIAASSSTICSGQPVVLTATGATNYLWSTGATSSSITINPNINTTYSVTTTYSAACSDTKTVSVTVNQTPTVAVNSTTICSGTNASITASGAANYSWDNGATTNSISVSPNANTNYTITGLTNGCSDTKTVSVTVNQTPTIAVSNGTICSGNSFTINPNGAATYSYSNGSAIVSPINTSTYTVTGSSFQNCTSVPQTLTVTVDANSTITSQPINQTLLAGTTAIFTVTATVGSVLQWQTNLGLGFQNLSNVSQYSGVNTATLTINNISISNDNQTFRCIAGTGLCSDTSDVATLSLSPVSVTELMLFKNITIYPNPATRQVTIIADAKLSGTVFTVYNYTGKSVIEGKINAENTVIDLENLSEGIYLINIGENIKQTFKVIKQ